MSSVRGFSVMALVSLGLLVLLAGGCARQQQSSYPAKPIEIVVHTDPGGGSDMLARLIGDIIQKNKLSSQPITVTNKFGASGGVALQYLLEKKGDGHTLLAHVNVIATTVVRGMVNANLSDLTPVATVEIDPSLLQVRADAPYKTFKDFLAAAKANPRKISAGFANVGSTDHILIYKMQKAAGVEFNFITYTSGSEAIAQMLGGHVDFTLGQPLEAKGQIEAGKIRALASFTDQRLPGLPDLPTAKEQGLDVTSRLYRGFLGPPGMPKEAVTYLENMFKKVTETAEWKDYVKTNQVDSYYLNAADSGKFFQEQAKELESLVDEMGLKKKS